MTPHMRFFRREHALLGLFGGLLALLAGCSPQPTQVAPPGRPVAEQGAVLWSVIPNARTIVRFTRSPDDSAGLDLVQSYVVMRRIEGDAEFVPFEYVPAPDSFEHGPREIVIVDTTAPPLPVQYVAYAIGEREFATLGTPGVRVTASLESEPFTTENISPVMVRSPDMAAPTVEAFTVSPVAGDDGHHVELVFTPISSRAPVDHVNYYSVLRAPSAAGPFLPFAGSRIDAPPPGSSEPITSRLTVPSSERYWFRLFAIGNAHRPVIEYASASPAGVASEATFFNWQKLNVAIILLLTVALTLFFMERAKKPGANMFVRRIPGIDAIEEAVGRATEMGRPVLYVPGIDEIQNIQTIASLLILGRVSEIVARYDTEILVPCCIPLVANVGEEVVRQGFYDAGRPDSHKPQNVQWISSEQFAFCAGTNGIMLRDKPATNIFLGRFFAESLILAETGYVNRAIQIAGTAEISQLPFFIAACDYTLIGEELFAVSAYMTRDPRLLSTLKAADWIKALVISILVVGAVVALASPAGGFTTLLLKFFNPGE